MYCGSFRGLVESLVLLPQFIIKYTNVNDHELVHLLEPRKVIATQIRSTNVSSSFLSQVAVFDMYAYLVK